MTGPVTVGIIGAGFSAALHAAALGQVRGVGVRIAAVASRGRERADNFARSRGIPTVYSDPADLIADPEIDVVCVCLPNSLHAETVLTALKAGKHVICEKPLTGAFGPSPAATSIERALDERKRSAATTAEILAAAERSGRTFMYAENWIYAPAVTKIVRLLEVSGGRVLDIRAEESHSGSHAVLSRRRETAGGGALLMLGSHPIGAALHIKRMEAGFAGVPSPRVTSVTAETARLYDSEAVAAASHNWIVSDWGDVETWANVVLAFEDGTRATIAASFAMLGGVRNQIEVYATNGAYRANLTPNDSLLAFTPDGNAFGSEYLHEKVESRTGWIFASPDEEWVRGYPQEMQDFIECVAYERHPVSDLTIAAQVGDIIYASYLSAEQGVRIDM